MYTCYRPLLKDYEKEFVKQHTKLFVVENKSEEKDIKLLVLDGKIDNLSLFYKKTTNFVRI